MESELTMSMVANMSDRNLLSHHAMLMLRAKTIPQYNPRGAKRVTTVTILMDKQLAMIESELNVRGIPISE
jgi:hypothetical protein